MNNLAIHGTNSLVESLNMNVSNHVLGLNNSQLASSTSSSLLSNSNVSPVSSYSTSMIGNNLNNSLANLNTLSANDESKTNLIINYLPQAMTQEDLRNLFSSIGELESCKLIRDKLTGQSLGYGFVNYVKCSDAEKAINSLNALRMQQKTIKVSFARPSTPLIKDANLYVSGLSKSMTQEDLQRIFHPYGRIITSRILVDPSTGMSRGVGFVRYDKRPEAENAISALNGTVPPGAKDPITVKFANNPSQKNQQVLQSLYAATSPTRRLATSTGGPLYHQTRSFRTGVNDLLSNVNMGLGAKRTTPYPEVRGAQIITAGGLQATAPALQIAPSGAEYLQPASYLPAGLTTVDPLSTLQALGPYPTTYQIPFQAAQLPRVGVLPSLTPGTSNNYGMLPVAQLPQAGAGANLRMLQSHAFSLPTATPGAMSAIPPQMAGTSAPSGPATTGATTPVATEENPLGGDGKKNDEVVAATTAATAPQWYSPLAPDLLSSMGVNSTATNQSSSSVIGQSANFGICIFVYNLAPETDESILWQLFGPFGAVTSVKVIRDFQTQKCKGYGFVTMTNYEEAFMAVCSLNGYKLGDRVLQVRFDVIS